MESGGKFYYEALLLSGALMQIGWADLMEFDPAPMEGSGVGDDNSSWAFDGSRRAFWNRGQQQSYGDSWRTGDVIGCAVDLSAGRMFFTINGRSMDDVPECRFEAAPGMHLVPAASLSYGQALQFEFGGPGREFRFGPPEGFAPVYEALYGVEEAADVEVSEASEEEDNEQYVPLVAIARTVEEEDGDGDGDAVAVVEEDEEDGEASQQPALIATLVQPAPPPREGATAEPEERTMTLEQMADVQVLAEMCGNRERALQAYLVSDMDVQRAANMLV